MAMINIIFSNKKSKTEFLLDHLFVTMVTAVLFYVFVYRNPAWMAKIPPRVFLMVVTGLLLLTGTVLSATGKRNNFNIIVTHVITYGFAAAVLYVDRFPRLVSVTIFACFIFAFILYTRNRRCRSRNRIPPKRLRRMFILKLRLGLMLIAVMFLAVIISHRISLFYQVITHEQPDKQERRQDNDYSGNNIKNAKVMPDSTNVICI